MEKRTSVAEGGAPRSARTPWDGVIPAHEQEIYRAAGFGASSGIGKRPALLVIDMQYRSLGTAPRPIMEAIAESVTCCGEYGWRAVPHVQRALSAFRARGLPVIFPHVAPKGRHDGGRFAEKLPGIMAIPLSGYDFVKEVAPLETELAIPKFHASAFFGTSLTSHLIDMGVDTLFVTGCTTSGCVRATVVDAMSLGFKVVVPHECVYDRSQVSHAVNLFDMAHKYADVVGIDDAVSLLGQLPGCA
jgi:maleamate amidohydrolase